MTGCKNSLVFLLGCLVFSAPAFAERVLTNSLESPSGPLVSVVEETYAVPKVQAASLKKLRIDTYGLMTGENDAVLNNDVWKTADFSDISPKITETRTQFLPPAAENLRRSLMLLNAVPPENHPDGGFITLKLQDLFQRGDFKSVRSLIEKIPPNRISDEISILYTDSSLMLNDTSAACLQAKKGYEGIYWQKLSAVCAAFDKNENKALLDVDLLNEQEKEDPFLTDAVDALLSERKISEQPDSLTPLNVFLLRLFNSDVPGSWLETDQIWALEALHENTGIPLEKRIAISEKLVKNGLSSSADLVGLYKQVPLETSVSSGPLYRGLMLKKAAVSPSADAKINFLQKAFDDAKKQNVFRASAFAAKDILSSLSPKDVKTPVSSDIIKTFALNGETEQAEKWYTAAGNAETAANAWYIMEIIQGGQTGESHLPQIQAMMAYNENKIPDKKLVEETDRVMLLLETLGFFNPDESWVYTSFSEESPENGFIEKLRSGSGETEKKSAGAEILEAFKELKNGYTGLLQAVQRLQKAGLSKEARLLSIELVSPNILSPE